MIKVSDLAAKAISANSRTFLSRFLHNGVEISGDVRSVITHKGSCGESTFTPGAIYSSYIDVVIDNCKESLSGKELTYQIGVVIDENTTEWYDIGKYTVHKPSTDVYTTSFTALGRISAKLGMLYQSELTFPTTIQNILDEISGNTGVSIITTGFDTSGVIENEITGYMYREVLAIIAGIFFAYATEDSAGNIVFANFKSGNIIRTDGDRTSVLPKFADADTEITGVRVSGGEITVIDPETGDEVYQDQTFVSGNPNVAIQNEFMTQALFDANAGNVIGFTFRPATVSISLGDFRIEPFDSLLVTDSLGVERTVPCMSIIHRFDGGIITEVVAPELQDDDSGTAFKGMFSQAIQRFQHDLISVKNLLAGTVTAEEIKANYATIENLNAANANIQKLQTDKLDASTADLKYATISNLQAAVGRISKLETVSLTAESAVIKALQTDKLDALVADLKYATISNLNAATASIEKLQADKLDASDADLKYATISNLEAAVGRISKLEADSLTAESAVIKNLQTEKLDAASADLKYATISNLNAATGRISKLETDSLTAESAIIKALQTDKLDAETADLNYATISSLNATNANITKLQSEKATVGQLEAVDGKIEDLTSKAITTENLSASVAKLGYATVANLNAAVGRISKLETDSLTAESAVIKSLQTDKLDASAAVLKYATISNLNTAVGRISKLETDSLTAESAIIKSLQSDFADIETLIFGSATGTVIHSSFANAVIAQLGDAQIKSAMIESITADKITSGSINTKNVSIQSADGSMVIADNTIQIKDGSTVRVQIGKDASDNYSIVICDTDGNVMFNTNGITENAIKSAIIRDGMVATNANISASKLNIDSLFTEINDSTKTIKSTRIYMDDVGQTLDIAYKSATSSVNNLSATVSSQGTQISAIQGQITSKVWQQDITTAKNELSGSIETLSTQYSTINQAVNSLNSTVASHTSQIAQKADSSTVATVSNKISALEQNLDGFQSTVSATYATKTTVNKTVKEVHRYYCAGGGGTVILEECTPIHDMDADYLLVALDVQGGRTYTVFWNGVPYTTTALEVVEDGMTGVILGDYNLLMGGESTGEPFVILTIPAQNATQFHDIYGSGIQTVSIVSGTGSAPTKPTAYPPGSPWSETEPTSGAVASTLCTVYVDGTFSYSDISENTAGEVAAGAVVAAGTAVNQAALAQDMAQIANDNAGNARTEAASAKSTADRAYNTANSTQTQVTQLETRVTQTESSITSQATSISDHETRISTVEQTANGFIISLQTTNNNVTAAQNAANTANSTANTARTEAAAAAKTATNYLKFDSSGLLVGDMTASTLGKNVLIYNNGVDIRSSTTVLASFQADKIELGKGNSNAEILFCNGEGRVAVKEYEGTSGISFIGDIVNLIGNKNIYMRSSTKYQGYSDEAHAGVDVISWYENAYGSYGSSAGLSTRYTGKTYVYGGQTVTSSTKTAQIMALTNHGAAEAIMKVSDAGTNINYLLELRSDKGVVLNSDKTTQAGQPGIYWKTINSKNPYIGYASDQTDGTFVWSITGTNYASGLAIGGGSGNLLYKGNNVLNAGNYTSYAPPVNHASADPGYGLGTNTKYGHVMLSDSTSSTSGASSGIAASPAAVKAAYDKANHSHPYASNTHTHNYLPLTGGTISGATTFSENVIFTKNIETKVAQVYALEIVHATPFIDFHFGNSTADYTSRIIENSKGALTVSGTISQTSDRRLKENIMPLGIPQLMPVDGGAVETDLHSELFDRLKPVQYNFINGNGKICYGLIAQDVVEAMHEVGIEENSLDLVHHNFWTEKTGKEKEQYSVSYNSLIALLIHEVQKLKSELNILKGEQLC